MEESRLFIPRVINSTSSSSVSRVFTYKSPVNGQVTKFFADRGVIHTIDEETGEYKSVSRKSFLLRASAINDMISHTTEPWLRDAARRLVDFMIEVARAAGDQGDPFQLVAKAKAEMSARAAKQRIGPVPGHNLPIQDPAELCARQREQAYFNSAR